MVVKGSKTSKVFTGLGVEQILHAISTFLNSDGGLKSENDCIKFNNCMKQLAGSMQTICTYLNVINATQDDTVLSKLLSCGAWETLHGWLSEFKELDESPVLVLLLETFQRLPVTMDMLKANTTAKIIKALRKHTDEDVKIKAADTVDKWMQLIKSKTSNSAGVSPSHPSSSTKNGEHKEKEKKKKRHKHSSDDKSEEAKPAVSPPKEEMDIDRDVPSPPPPSIFKDSSKSTGSDKPDTSTAKQHNVKERSAGVEAGLIKPKPRGSKPAKTSVNSPKPLAVTSLSSHKRVNIELPGLSELGATPGSKKPKIDPDKEEDFGKAKLIAPLPKPAHIVQDSGGFMEALMQPRPPLVIKKKRSNSSKPPTSPTEKTSPPNTPLSPISAPPSFYKDTLEGPSGVSPPHPPSVDSSDRLSPVESTVSSLSTTDDNKSEPMDTSVTKPTKRVSFKPEKQLRQYHYFELLEDERVNVNRLRDQGGFDEMKKREMLSDRAALKSLHIEEAKSLKHSNAPAAVTEKFTWTRPQPIDLPADKFQPGYQSQERGVQMDREIKVLAAIYFSKAAIPTSAAEPDHSSDMETSSVESALNIPLEVNSTDVMANSYQPEVNQPIIASEPAPRAALLDAPVESAQTVSDLVPGVTANDMNLIQRLANGEGGQEILEALAKTTPDYLNQIMQTEGISPLDGNLTIENGNGPSLLGDHPSDPPPNFNRPMMNPEENRGGFRGSNFNRGRGGSRPPFNRGGFRGGGPGGQWNGRGRGGFRGRGKGECFRFVRNGKCEFGDKCMYLHSTPR